MAEVYEVATFYAHFDVVGDGEPRPPKVTIRVCDSLSCMLAGAEELLGELQSRAAAGRARSCARPASAPAIRRPRPRSATTTSIMPRVAKLTEIAARGDVHPADPRLPGLRRLSDAGGYAVLRACLSGARKVEDVIAALSDGGLRGLGGAGFPTGRKWGLVRAEKGPRLMAVNGDEGEPGTFKDRYLSRARAAQVPRRHADRGLGGGGRAGLHLHARRIPGRASKILKQEIAKLEAAGLAKHTKLHIRRGAGAYICGEESAMIESIEGKRGFPRHRPPYVAQVGMFGRPTLVNNIETLYWVPAILEKGAAWFAAQGKNGAKGLRSYSVSGRVKKPGVVLTAAGSTCQGSDRAVRRHGRGPRTSRAICRAAPRAASCRPTWPTSPSISASSRSTAAFVGSHAVVILSDKDDMKAVALNLMRFFEDESCGQCTPCRNGTEKAVQADERGRLESRAAGGSVPGDGGCLHLRPRPGGAQPGPERVQVFPGGPAVSKLPQAIPTVQVDNERVRVTEWRFAPGAETGEHIHQMDYVVVPSGNGRLKLVSPQGEESFADLKHGVSYFRKAGVHHNVINANDFEFAFVEIELKS